MQGAQLVPDVPSYSATISSCEKLGTLLGRVLFALLGFRV